MAEQKLAQRMGYESALRVIGRHLDAEPAYHVSILEVADGFTVCYRPSRHHSDGRTIHFTWDRLRDLDVFQTAARGLKRKPSRHQGMWDKFVTGHQDLLRAVGFTLDHDRASGLSVAEIPEGVAISYLRPDPTDPVQSQMCHSVMTTDEIEALLESAQQRRELKLTLVNPAG